MHHELYHSFIYTSRTLSSINYKTLLTCSRRVYRTICTHLYAMNSLMYTSRTLPLFHLDVSRTLSFMNHKNLPTCCICTHLYRIITNSPPLCVTNSTTLSSKRLMNSIIYKSQKSTIMLYGVALVSRIDKSIGLFCKRAQ